MRIMIISVYFWFKYAQKVLPHIHNENTKNNQDILLKRQLSQNLLIILNHITTFTTIAQ